MTKPNNIAGHYAGGVGAAESLLASISQGLEAIGTSIETATVEDLAPADEFHVGGRAATTELCGQLDMNGSSAVLDIGSGIGGPARFMASKYGANVVGVDLTPEYVEVANKLSQAVGLGELNRFEHASATDLHFEAATFDIATQLHVGMNIADKDELFRQVFRVLRSGGRFGVYDIMSESDDAIAFPVPWASDPSMSFVASPATYRTAAEAAGFTLVSERNRSDFANDFFAQLRARAAQSSGPPAMGLQFVMGPDTQLKVGNMVSAVVAGSLAPVEMIWQKP